MDSKYTYRLIDNNTGYELIETSTGNIVQTQPAPFAHLYFKDGSVEENAIAHINQIIADEKMTEEQQAAEEKKANDFKQMRADVDYLLMVGEAG